MSSLPRAAQAVDMSGRLVGSYRLLRLIGHGGMGAVYEAAHQQLPRRVAVKVLNSEFAGDPEILDRFFNEARAVNIVQHPDIVSISELGQLADGAAYLVMELLQGEPLSQRMYRVGKLPVAEALRIGRQIALPLAAAHGKGIVHRDLKPDNVMIVADPDGQGERAKLLDFGIAKLAEEHQGARQVKTRAGVVLGTPVYMAPEQCRGAAEVDHKADVYSLGVMLYQMLAGRPPFEAEGEGELVAMHIYEEPTPVAERVPLVPAELSALVQQMLEKDREQRPTMAEVAARLEQLGAGRTSGAVPVVPLVPLSGPPVSLAEPPVLPARGRESTPTGARGIGPVPAARRRGVALGLAVALLGGAALLGVPAWRALRRTPAVAAPLPLSLPPQRIRWSIETEPPSADIVRVADGKILSRTPFREDRVAAPGSLAVILRRRGYEDKRIDLDLSANVMVREVLQPLPAPPPAPPSPMTVAPAAEPRRPPRARGKARPAAPDAAPAASAPEVEDFEQVNRAQGGDGDAR